MRGLVEYCLGAFLVLTGIVYLFRNQEVTAILVIVAGMIIIATSGRNLP